MRLSHKEQWKLFEAGATLVNEKGIAKKILGPSGWPQNISSCLGFRNVDGIWFYGSGPFDEDENLIIED